MRKLLFVVLMLSFVIGNAQQARQYYGPSNREEIRLTNGIKPGYTSENDLYRNSIMETENLGLPSRSDIYLKRMMKPDMHPGYPSESEPNKNKMMKTDGINPGFHRDIDQYSKKIMKPN